MFWWWAVWLWKNEQDVENTFPPITGGVFIISKPRFFGKYSHFLLFA